MSTDGEFAGGRNIAMKVPPHVWEATVRFYRDVVGLKVIEHAPTVPPSVGFEFGANQLWIDRVDGLSQAEIWLELIASDVQAAASHLESAGIVRRDEIEPLPEGFEGFWIRSPASIIHLVSRPDQY
jgi:catechol 2,3-dioxygenase-like lactoylglutathione lyase family enzyme